MARDPFQYSILRVVPRVERGEAFNVGIVLICRPQEFLGARTVLDRTLLSALEPTADAEQLQSHLTVIEGIAAGKPEAGPIALLTPGERFHWLVAPSSTIIQPSAAHTGLCEGDPTAQLDRLFAELVQRTA